MDKSIEHRHPREMYFLAAIEMCQRFAFWGIGNLLVLYLVQFHRFSDAKADELYGIFSGVAFVLPLLGGYLADKTSHIGSVVYGSLLTAAGCLLIALGKSEFLYIALALAACGASLFTPSIYTLLGRAYRQRHHLREGGFSIYYAAVNLGVFLATFLLGGLGGMGHWTLAFLIACFVQIVGLFLFLSIRKSAAFTPMDFQRKRGKQEHLNAIDRSRIGVILALAAVSLVFWMAYNQGWSSMSLFALHFTDLHWGDWSIPPSWILSLESFYLVILAFPLAKLYRFLVQRNLDPSPIAKTVLSLVVMGLCFLLMGVGARSIPPGATSGAVSPLFPIASYFLMALGEMLLAPVGLSLVTHLSPHRYTAFLVGAWYLCIGLAFYLGGTLAALMSKFTSLSAFFDLFTIACGVAAVALALFAKKLNQMRHIS